jgi:hypothetical protein
MKLSAPTMVVFLISVAIAVLGLLARYAGVTIIPLENFHLMLVAWLVLAAGCVLKGV